MRLRLDRRGFVGAAATMVTAASISGAGLAMAGSGFAIRQVKAGVLNVAYVELG